MIIDSKEWHFKEDNYCYAMLGIDLTVYWKGSIFDREEGILNFYNEIMNRYSDKFHYYETETMSGAKAIDKETFKMLPFWLKKKQKNRDMYMLQLEGGEYVDEPSEYSFIFRSIYEKSNPAGLLKIMLPISILKDGKDSLLDFYKKAMQALLFDSGHGGFSLNWDSRGDYSGLAEEKIFHISRRYIGVDLFYLPATLSAIRKSEKAGIKCINWLTLIGSTICDELGGFKRIVESLDDRCTFHQVNNGLIIQAGPDPILGDVNRQEDMSVYHLVGRLLSKVRLARHPSFIENPSDPEDESTSTWLSRFD